MKKVTTFLLAAAMLLAGATFALAEDVFVTQYGKKYHKAESHYLQGKEGVIKLTREEAEEQGYEPSKEFMESEEETKKN